MYENEYEDYMRSVLGYPINNTYNINSFPYRNDSNNSKEEKYESLFPDIYKMLKPMVTKACEGFNGTISDDKIESMTMEIYNNIEADTTMMDCNSNTISREAENVKTQSNMSRGDSKTSSQSSSNNISQKANVAQKESENGEDLTRGCCGNPLMKDLIKILLLNQIINNNNNRPPRPPAPRPPYPPRPPRPMYRDFENQTYYNNNNYNNFINPNYYG